MGLLLAPQENSGEPSPAGCSGLGQEKDNLMEFAFFVKLVPCAPLTDLGTDGRASWRGVGDECFVSFVVRVQVGACMTIGAHRRSIASRSSAVRALR